MLTPSIASVLYSGPSFGVHTNIPILEPSTRSSSSVMECISNPRPSTPARMIRLPTSAGSPSYSTADTFGSFLRRPRLSQMTLYLLNPMYIAYVSTMSQSHSL